MGRLFDRVSRLTVSTMDLTDFRYKFHIEKTIKPEPNHTRIEVYNLSVEHRQMLEQLAPGKKVKGKRSRKTSPNLHGVIPVQLEAGYKDDGPQIVFLGDLVTVDSERDGPDWITTITSGDGARAYRTARIDQSFKAGTPVATAVRSIAKALGLGDGNLNDVVGGLALNGNASVFKAGMVMSGSAARVMTNICRSVGIDWSCQDGALTLVNKEQALAGKAIKLTQNTGMIGSPNVDGDGILKVKTLMIPNMRIGRLIVLDSLLIDGNFRVEKIVTDGDTHDAKSDWGHEIEAKRY